MCDLMYLTSPRTLEVKRHESCGRQEFRSYEVADRHAGEPTEASIVERAEKRAEVCSCQEMLNKAVKLLMRRDKRLYYR